MIYLKKDDTFVLAIYSRVDDTFLNCRVYGNAKKKKNVRSSVGELASND